MVLHIIIIIILLLLLIIIIVIIFIIIIIIPCRVAMPDLKLGSNWKSCGYHYDMRRFAHGNTRVGALMP